MFLHFCMDNLLLCPLVSCLRTGGALSKNVWLVRVQRSISFARGKTSGGVLVGKQAV